MTENSAEPAAPLDYKRHQIVLTSRQQADHTWVCQYVIRAGGNPQADPGTGHADGSFPSREAAELAAVQKAKALIDLF
ncbi:MAG: hypothetical protein A4E19_17880 [Nitrospira sp. SG-bin1]|nr:MAG: hypothetical protein A4E19_17880 [Nitrospira sp. SG-bin1]